MVRIVAAYLCQTHWVPLSFDELVPFGADHLIGFERAACTLHTPEHFTLLACVVLTIRIHNIPTLTPNRSLPELWRLKAAEYFVSL